MDRHVQLPNVDHAVVTVLPLDAVLLIHEPIAVERGFLAERAACHFPIADSGRELRALIASLLV